MRTVRQVCPNVFVMMARGIAKDDNKERSAKNQARLRELIAALEAK